MEFQSIKGILRLTILGWGGGDNPANVIWNRYCKEKNKSYLTQIEIFC